MWFEIALGIWIGSVATGATIAVVIRIVENIDKGRKWYAVKN